MLSKEVFNKHSILLMEDDIKCYLQHHEEGMLSAKGIWVNSSPKKVMKTGSKDTDSSDPKIEKSRVKRGAFVQIGKRKRVQKQKFGEKHTKKTHGVVKTKDCIYASCF